MELILAESASAILRWLHVIAGIAWIGSSFYFIHLDLSLKPRPGLPQGVKGDEWQVHGGGFYHMMKYLVAPAQTPDSLTWLMGSLYDLAVGICAAGAGFLFRRRSLSENVGLVGVTGVRSRWVTAVGGVVLLILGLIPKLGALVTAVPLFVLGGAGIVMFGMVAVTGIRILASVDYKANRNNLFIVAIAIGFGMIPLVAPAFFTKLPKELEPLLNSGIVLAAVAAVLLNAYYNGAGSQGMGGAGAANAAKASDRT